MTAPSTRGPGVSGGTRRLQHAADRWYVLGAAEMDAARAVVAEDMQRQRARMVNADAGTPQPKRAWPMATRRSTCMRCNFLELCRDDFPVAPEREPWSLTDDDAPLRPGAAS